MARAATCANPLRSALCPVVLECEARGGYGPPIEDAKEVFEGLNELSMHCVLDQSALLNEALSVENNRFGVNRPDADGDRYPIHWAAARGHAMCAYLLVLFGADPRCAPRLALSDWSGAFSYHWSSLPG